MSRIVMKKHNIFGLISFCEHNHRWELHHKNKQLCQESTSFSQYPGLCIKYILDIELSVKTNVRSWVVTQVLFIEVFGVICLHLINVGRKTVHMDIKFHAEPITSSGN